MPTNLQWIHKEFAALSVAELYALMQLRMEVFVLEQECLYRELDGLDAECIHLMAFEPEHQALAAYSRIVPPRLSFPEPSIGRVITAQAHRGKGLGVELMERSIANCVALYPNQPIRIGAQAHLQKFYGSLGFVSQGDIYDEDGIPHIEMVLQ